MAKISALNVDQRILAFDAGEAVPFAANYGVPRSLGMSSAAIPEKPRRMMQNDLQHDGSNRYGVELPN